MDKEKRNKKPVLAFVTYSLCVFMTDLPSLSLSLSHPSRQPFFSGMEWREEEETRKKGSMKVFFRLWYLLLGIFNLIYMYSQQLPVRRSLISFFFSKFFHLPGIRLKVCRQRRAKRQKKKLFRRKREICYAKLYFTRDDCLPPSTS